MFRKVFNMDKSNAIETNKVLNVLNICYEKAVDGLPTSKSCYALANEYLEKHKTPERAIKEFIKWQVAKCTTSGFVTSLGGILTLPVAIPANLTTVWYVQLRMIATIAVLSGFDPTDDDVRTLAYICLTGSSATKVFKEAGITTVTKITKNMIGKIPGTVLTKINQKIGMRFITKFGTTGAVNLGKAIPVVGGIVGGGIDLVTTKVIAAKAKKIFLLDELD